MFTTGNQPLDVKLKIIQAALRTNSELSKTY